jgi:peptidoglycan-associated lipoprotein
MKANALSRVLLLTLTLTITAVGCKKGDPKVTDVGPGKIGKSSGNGLDGGLTFKASDSKPISSDQPWDRTAFIENREALAGATVHFDLDSATLKSSEAERVLVVARALRENMNARLLIEGHCDDRGTEEYNRSLGERRAVNLREELVNHGINTARIQTMTFGEDRPLDESETEMAWQKNRRGEFVLMMPRQ